MGKLVEALIEGFNGKIVHSLGWLGAAFGVAGASLLSFNLADSAYGYALFFISSLFLVVWAFLTSQKHQLFMQAVYLCINVNGIYHWILEPMLK